MGDVGTYRVFRGGGWGNGGADGCRAASRYGGTPGSADVSIGFRLARSSRGGR